MYPFVDISEDENEIKVEADLPGIKREDIEVDVDRNVLTIKGERKREEKEEKENYHRSECCYGKFQRSFTLPSNIDVDEIKANFKDGVLKLSLPKLQESKGKKIEIKSE